jgi:hypothetical protein
MSLTFAMSVVGRRKFLMLRDLAVKGLWIRMAFAVLMGQLSTNVACVMVTT